MNENVYELLLAQQKQIRELKLHLEALKRMMFEHQLGAVESSGFLRESDESIRRLERQVQDSRKS